ncbi:kelch-like protein 21 [Tubulanus polymorphus]|uniref:kelch-like protein 21 n=1 Tax=Tubulanus polymorphus TaxID=672921 RepID=UPI003DA39209
MDRRGSEPFPEQSFTLNDRNYSDDILNGLNLLRTRSEFTDAVLCVGLEEIPCHRNVLAVSSPYFKAMFTCDLKESREGRININEISARTMRQIVDYVYSGCLEITIDNAQEILAAASLFEYPAIVDACCEFSRVQLHPSNCLGIEHFAYMHSCKSLQEESRRFVLDNFSCVVEHEEFLELPLDRLISYISSDLIDVRSEELVYRSVMSWINHDLDGRREQFPDIFEYIRLPTIKLQYLEEVVAVDDLVRNFEACSTLVNEAKKYHESKVSGQTQQRRLSMRSLPRPSTVAKEVMVVIGGLNNNNVTSASVEMYEPHKDKWSFLPDIPQAVSCFGISALNNSIYVTGGCLGDGILVASVWRFNCVGLSWSAEEPMLQPRAKHTSGILGNNLYVIGGVVKSRGKSSCFEQIDCFNLDTGQWTSAGTCPFPRQLSRLVPYNETLIEIGGTQRDTNTKTIESYICTTNNLRYSGEQFVLGEPIQYAQIAIIDGKFYIIWEDNKKVISFSPEKRTVRRLPDMHFPHMYSSATVLNGKIYITGGINNQTAATSRIVEVYDPELDEWTVVKCMKSAKSYHGCVSICM